MKVYTVYNDQAVFDLVAHFLGIATHANINAAPAAISQCGGDKTQDNFRQQIIGAGAAE